LTTATAPRNKSAKKTATQKDPGNRELAIRHREGPCLVFAISAATKSIELDPHLVQAYDLLASLYLQASQPERAVKACRTALNIMPKDQQAIYTLILALRKTGAKEELKGLVQTLTDLRKEEQAENNRKNRYGQLVEGP
jgi:tetratricopeptide (TPR) repeat protein